MEKMDSMYVTIVHVDFSFIQVLFTRPSKRDFLFFSFLQNSRMQEEGKEKIKT